MAKSTAAWDKVFKSGSKAMQDRLMKAHAKNPEFQSYLKSQGMESGERSAKQATTSLKKATDTKIAAQKIADMRYKKALQASSERVREMGRRRRESGEGLGGGLETAKDVIAHVKKYGSIKAGRLGEENLNELKDATLKSYLEKRPSPKIKDVARPETVGKPEERAKDIARANLTRIGRARAKSKLLKRNPPPRTAPTEDPNDRGYGQGRYMGDDVNLEGQTMNEGKMKDIVTGREETARLKAQEILGGPVKEKPKMPPGKQPAGYRYVRGLARKAMKAGMKKEEIEISEEIKDQADIGEYDYEGDMAKSQLRSILANAKRMHDMLEENTNLPEWVQSKITLAQDYIQTAASYMEAEMNEEVKQVEEGAKDWKKAFSNVAQKNLQKDVGKMRSKVGRLNYIGMKPKVDERPKVTAAVTKGGTYSEEVVTEAEGKVAMTPKEKELAAHHGDKTKITYGDVIKARIKSSKEKALKGNNQ